MQKKYKRHGEEEKWIKFEKLYQKMARFGEGEVSYNLNLHVFSGDYA